MLNDTFSMIFKQCEPFCTRLLITREESGCCLLFTVLRHFLGAGVIPSIMDPFFLKSNAFLHRFPVKMKSSVLLVSILTFVSIAQATWIMDRHGDIPNGQVILKNVLRQHLVKLLEKIKSPFWNTLSSRHQKDAVKYDLRRVPRPRQLPKWYKYPLRG